jgi:hypothetical protein
MKEKASRAGIQVEERSSDRGGFGLAAPKRSMTFGEFADQVEHGRLYLTTQEIPHTSKGYEDLFAEPLQHLREDFPLQPSLLGHLGE